MRMKNTAILALALTLVLPGLAAADDSAVRSADLDAALAASSLQDDAARQQVRALLARDEVRVLAEAAGLDLRHADAAVATLEGEELQQLAQHAAAADRELTGGTAIALSLGALILIVVLIIVLVD